MRRRRWLQPCGELNERKEQPDMTADAADVGQGQAPDEDLLPRAQGTDTAEAKRSAFANVPVSDYVTDVVAAILLLVSLSLPWAAKDGVVSNAGDITWVLPVTLLSVLTLALPYLARFGALPARWTVHSTRRVRLWANLPYVVAVVVHLVLDGAELAGYRGIGTAVALGLAGAVLSATPRRCELGPVDSDRRAAGLWWTIAVGFTAAMGALLLIWIALFSVEFFKLPSLSAAGGIKAYITVLVEALAVGFLFLAPALLTITGRSFAWRNVAITLGTVVAVVFFLGGADQSALETLRSSVGRAGITGTGAGVVLIPAVAAVLASPAVARALRQQHAVTNWLTTGNAALRFIAMTGGALTVVSAVGLVEGHSLAAGITAIVLLLIPVVLSLLADKAMLKNIAEGRSIALVVAGITLILGICLLATSPVEPLLVWLGSNSALTWAQVTFALGLPILIWIALAAPQSVREFFKTNAPAPKEHKKSAYEWREPVTAQAQAQHGTAYGQVPPMSAQQAPEQAPAPAPAQPHAQAGHIPHTQSAVYDQSAPIGSPAGNADGTTPAAPAHVSTPAQPLAPEQPSQEQQVQEQPASQAGGLGSDPAHPQTEAVTDRLDVRDISSGFTAHIAADPGTPAAVLAQIVEEAPHLRPDVASNPSTYPALLDWLRELGDPAVDEALRTRDQ